METVTNQSIENLRITINELDKLIADSRDKEKISELKEIRDKLSKIVESYENRQNRSLN